MHVQSPWRRGTLLTLPDGDRDSGVDVSVIADGSPAIKGGMMRLINLTKLLAFCTVLVFLALPAPAAAL